MSYSDEPHALAEPLDMYDLELQVHDGIAVMSRCARELAEAGMNIDAVNYSGVNGTAALHLLVQDGPEALRILAGGHVSATCRPVLVYTLPNQPGTLARYSGALLTDAVRIDFIYQATAKGVVVAAPDLAAVRASFSAAAAGG
ncbi:MAG: hypothetical protein ACREN2_11760 [Candidatus Dormibacteria bacterium]